MGIESLRSEIEKEASEFAERVTKKAILSFAQAFSGAVNDAAKVAGPESGVVTPVPGTRPKGRPGRKSGKTEKKPCKVEGCDLSAVAKGMCSKHYQKARNKAKAREAKGEKAVTVTIPKEALEAPNGATPATA